MMTRPVLRYHGGKWRLAPWVIEHLPPHRIYVEPFGGAGSVLMRKPRSYSEVYNDAWSTVVEVFRVLRDPDLAAQLRTALELTPYSREEFMDAAYDPSDPLLERVRKTVLRSFGGYGSASTNGNHQTGFRSNSNRSHTTPAHDWRNYPDCIPAFVDRLRGVVIENRSAAEVIAQHDAPDAVIYCDPPYLHETRNMRRGNAAYAHEMDDAAHIRLAEALHAVRGAVVLSGYPSPLYDRLYRDWERVERLAHADGANERLEVLWLSPRASASLGSRRAAQLSLLGEDQP